jgi:hypothetical protein
MSWCRGNGCSGCRSSWETRCHVVGGEWRHCATIARRRSWKAAASGEGKPAFRRCSLVTRSMLTPSSPSIALLQTPTPLCLTSVATHATAPLLLLAMKYSPSRFAPKLHDSITPFSNLAHQQRHKAENRQHQQQPGRIISPAPNAV